MATAILPTLWFRNTWSWDNDAKKPTLRQAIAPDNIAPDNIASDTVATVEASHPTLGQFWFYCEPQNGQTPPLLFIENETNNQRLFGGDNASVYVKDTKGSNVFEGGFLGLDNIGVLDRSSPLPTGGRIEQSDGTSWMGMYCLNMLTIALGLAIDNPVYEDMATKFFEHFLYIANAMNHTEGESAELWDEADGFYSHRHKG